MIDKILPDSRIHYAEQPDGAEVARHAGLIRVECHLTGTTPLLQNAMSEEELLRLWNKEKAPKTAARPSLREAADARVYRLGDGRPHLPVKNLYACFIKAGQFVRMDGRRQVSTADSTNLTGMLWIKVAELPLFTPGTVAAATWEVDIQQGRNPNGGEAICIVRPRFDAWEVRLILDVEQRQMALDVARGLVDIAGGRIGVGDFRPQCKGTFGQFKVNRWAILPAA